MLLANHFATRMSYELGRSGMPSFAPAAVLRLEGYIWKGNIRELKNVVERAVYRADTGIIEEITFDPFVSPYVLEDEPKEQAKEPVTTSMRQDSLDKQLARLEISLLRQALVDCRYNQRRAASSLGLTYDQLRGKIKKYGEAVIATDGS